MATEQRQRVGVVLLGMALGFLLASVFASVGSVMLFIILKNTPPGLQKQLGKLSPKRLTMSLVILGYPTWGAIGAVMELVYRIAKEQLPGPGIGSPNLVFTIAVLATSIGMAAPFIILLRQVAAGVVIIAVVFVGLFGWFLPLFSSPSEW